MAESKGLPLNIPIPTPASDRSGPVARVSGPVPEQIINKDPMDMVDGRYKEALGKDLEASILEVKANLSKDLVETLGSFGEAQLGAGGARNK